MNFRFCSENADEKGQLIAEKKGRARWAPSCYADPWKQSEVSGPLLWWCSPGWWKLRRLVYMLTSWTDCLVSKGGFGDVPAPDLSHTFFFWPAQLWVGKPGLSTQGWCQQQPELQLSSLGAGSVLLTHMSAGLWGRHSWLHCPQAEGKVASFTIEAVQTHSHNTRCLCLPTWVAAHAVFWIWAHTSVSAEEAARVNCSEFPKSERVSASEDLLV